MEAPSKTSEELNSLFYTYRSCEACGLHQNKKRLLSGAGSPGAKVVFLLDRVSYQASLSGNILDGQEGQVLMNLLEHLGLPPDQFWYSYVVLCPPKGTGGWKGSEMLSLPKASELTACRSRVHKEVHTIQPEMIIACGGTALKSLHAKKAPPFTSNVGRVLESPISGDLVSYPIPTMVTYSMLHLIRNQKSTLIWNKCLDHISEAIAISETLSTMRMVPDTVADTAQ